MELLETIDELLAIWAVQYPDGTVIPALSKEHAQENAPFPLKVVRM